MTASRTFSALRLWALAWFMASLGVAIASPLVHPQSIEIVCSSTGALQLVVQTDDGVVEMGKQSAQSDEVVLRLADPTAGNEHPH